MAANPCRGAMAQFLILGVLFFATLVDSQIGINSCSGNQVTSTVQFIYGLPDGQANPYAYIYPYTAINPVTIQEGNTPFNILAQGGPLAACPQGGCLSSITVSNPPVTLFEIVIVTSGVVYQVGGNPGFALPCNAVETTCEVQGYVNSVPVTSIPYGGTLNIQFNAFYGSANNQLPPMGSFFFYLYWNNGQTQLVSYNNGLGSYNFQGSPGSINAIVKVPGPQYWFLGAIFNGGFIGDQPYLGTYCVASLTVTAAPMTVTAGSYTVIQGTSVTIGPAAYTGVVPGDVDSLEVITTCTPTPATIATLAVGQYPTSCTVASGTPLANSYQISYVSGTLTVQAGTCNTPPALTNGNAGNCASGTASGAPACALGCNSGYSPSGSLSISCFQGNWGTPSGSCAANPCTAPSTLTNGNLGTCTASSTPSGSSACALGCNTGYHSTGSLSITCTTGTWSSPAGTCFPNPCSAAPSITNGNAGTCTANTASGASACTLGCASGFTPIGSLSVSCSLGQWSTPTGTCTQPVLALSCVSTAPDGACDVPVYGESFIYQLEVSTAPYLPTATAVVDFNINPTESNLNGVSVQCSAVPLSYDSGTSGYALCEVTPTDGGYTVQASYIDSTYGCNLDSDCDQTSTLTVATDTATATLSCTGTDCSTPAFGTAVDLTYTLTTTESDQTGGSVVFTGSDGNDLDCSPVSPVPLVPVSLSVGANVFTADCITSSLPNENNQVITATYVNPALSCNPCSATTTESVASDVATTSLSCSYLGASCPTSAYTVYYGQPQTYTFTATGASSTPVGTIDFQVGGITLCSAPLQADSNTNEAQAQCTINNLDSNSGTTDYTVTATYSNPGYACAPCQDVSTSFSVLQASTSITGVSFTPSPSVFGETVTISATINDVTSGSTAAPNGNAVFHFGGATYTVQVINGLASKTTTTLAVGTYSPVLIEYPQTANFLATSDSSTSLTVGQATLTIAATSPTMVYGSTVPAVSATFSGFQNGDTANPSALSCTTTASSTSNVGSYPTSCTYSAVLPNYNVVYVQGSLSVTPATPTVNTVSFTSSSPYYYGEPLSVQTSVTGVTGGTTPTGTVTFYDNNNQLVGTLNPATLTSGSGIFAITHLLDVTSVTAHSITAIYTPANTEINYIGASTNTAYTPTISAAIPVITITNPTSPVNYGAFTFSVSVTSPYASSGLSPVDPTGTVVLTESGSVQVACSTSGPLAVTNGVATCSPSPYLQGGTYQITATFTSGDNNYVSGASVAYALSDVKVTPTVATVTISSPAGPTYYYGQPLTLQTSVTGVAGGEVPGGTIQFYDNGIPITGLGSPATVTAGTAAFTITSPLAVGSGHSITATYFPAGTEADYLQASTQNALAVTITAATPTVSTVSFTTPSPFYYGDLLTLTTTVTGSTLGVVPTGSVTFYDNNVQLTGALNPATLSVAGVASFTITTPLSVVGPHSLTATYTPANTDHNYVTAQSNAYVPTISPAAVAFTLSTTPNSPVEFELFSFNIALNAQPPGVGQPQSGYLTISDSELSLLINRFTVTSGLGTSPQITIDTSTTQTLVVSFISSDSNFASGVTSVQFPIAKDPTQITQFTSTPNPSTFGQTVTISLLVSTNPPPVTNFPTGSGIPTGTVNIVDQSTGTTYPVSLSPTGSATFTTTALSVGPHSFVANYLGDGNNAASSTSTAINQGVIADTVTVSLGCSSPSSSTCAAPVYGQAFTFTVLAEGGFNIPVGSIVFADGATTLCSVPLQSDGHALESKSLCTTSGIVGSNTITATYQPTSSFTCGAACALTYAINVAQDPATDHLQCTTNCASPILGSAIIFTYTLNPTNSNPIGIVSFTDGATTLCSTSLSNTYTATCTTTALPTGAQTVTATYTNAGLSCSPCAATTQVTLSPGSATVKSFTVSSSSAIYGQPTTLTFVIAGPTTPTGSVTVAGLGTGASCTSMTLAADGTANEAKATCTAANIPVGSHSITATYNNPQIQCSSSPCQATASLTVTAAATSIPVVDVVISPNPVVHGQPLSLSATVTDISSGSTAIPVGTVLFKFGTTGGQVLATLINGVAHTTTSSIPAGTYSPLSITYTPSSPANFLSSTVSSSVTVSAQSVGVEAAAGKPQQHIPGQLVVLKGDPTISVISLPKSDDHTYYILSPKSPSLTVEVVTPPSNVPATGKVTATDTFNGKSQSLAAVTLKNGKGTFTFSYTPSSVGVHTYVISYHGDQDNNPEALTVKAIYYQFPIGQFLIGNKATTVGHTAYFYGPSWASKNGFSSTSLKSFQGYVNNTGGKVGGTTCGVNFATPLKAGKAQTLPAYMGVFIASSVNATKTTVSGTTDEIAILKIVSPALKATSAGQAAIVAKFCPSNSQTLFKI